MLWKIAILLSCLYYCADAACENLLSDIYTYTIRDGNGTVLETFTDCETLVEKHPILCKDDAGKQDGVCCKLCRSKRNQLRCIDNTLITFNGMSCADYVDDDVCNCDNKQQNVRKECCASCKNKKCPPCRDYLSSENPIIILDSDGKPTGERIESCDDLIENYLYLCKQRYGKKGGHCCESCSEQDLSCLDGSIKYIVGGKQLSCEEYVGQDGCRCDDAGVRKNCCKSCKNAECDPCQDTLGANSWIDVPRPNGKKQRIRNCKTLVDKYLSLCRKYGNEGGQCCESCSEEDLDCIDDSLHYYVVNGRKLTCAQYIERDPCACENEDVAKICCASCEEAECVCEDSTTWTGTVRMGKDKCMKCTCAEIKARGDNWMIKACRPMRARARKECCKSCTDLGYPPK